MAAVVAGFAAYYVSSSTELVYTSRAKIVVERHQTPGIPSASDFSESAVLAQNYADLVVTRPVLGKTSEKLQISYGRRNIAGKVKASTRRNVINIDAEDTNPLIAAAIANLTAETFIEIIIDRQLSQLASFQKTVIAMLQSRCFIYCFRG